MQVALTPLVFFPKMNKRVAREATSFPNSGGDHAQSAATRFLLVLSPCELDSLRLKFGMNPTHETYTAVVSARYASQ